MTIADDLEEQFQGRGVQISDFGSAVSFSTFVHSFLHHAQINVIPYQVTFDVFALLQMQGEDE